MCHLAELDALPYKVSAFIYIYILIDYYYYYYYYYYFLFYLYNKDFEHSYLKYFVKFNRNKFEYDP